MPIENSWTLTGTRILTKSGKRISESMYWKKRRKRRNRGKVKRLESRAVLCVLLLLGGIKAECADKLKELQDRFDKETHAANKVKALDKLAEAQFEAGRKASDSGDYITVGLTLEKYRDNVNAAFLLLKKQEPDVDRHSTGYRQIELQVRRGIREVEETLLTAPVPLRPPLEIVRKDLVEIDDELIRLLFPRRTKDPEKIPAVPEEKP